MSNHSSLLAESFYGLRRCRYGPKLGPPGEREREGRGERRNRLQFVSAQNTVVGAFADSRFFMYVHENSCTPADQQLALFLVCTTFPISGPPPLSVSPEAQEDAHVSFDLNGAGYGPGQGLRARDRRKALLTAALLPYLLAKLDGGHERYMQSFTIVLIHHVHVGYQFFCRQFTVVSWSDLKTHPDRKNSWM